jgi:hypothetical protein
LGIHRRESGVMLIFSLQQYNKMSIKEKWATEIAEQVRNGASESDVLALLWSYLEEEVEDKTRYDFDDFGEVVTHPEGEYVRYDALHS